MATQSPCLTVIGLTLEAKLRVQGRECIVKVSPADEDYAAIGGWVHAGMLLHVPLSHLRQTASYVRTLSGGVSTLLV